MQSTVLKFLGVLFLILGLASVSGPAWAVISGDVVVIDQGEPLPEATVTLIDEDGNQVAEGETDDDGAAVLIIPDSAKGKTLTVRVTDRSGKRRDIPGFVVPQDNWSRIEVQADSGRIVMVAPAPSGFFGQLGGPILVLDIHGGYVWGSADTRIDSSFGTSDSGGIDLDSLLFGGDVQVLLPVGDTWDAVALIGGTWFADGDDRSQGFDFHPTAGDDTFGRADRGWALDFGVGGRVPFGDHCMPGERQCVAVTGVVGASIVRTDFSLHTDETGGGGQMEVFEDSETDVGFFGRLALDFPLCPQCEIPIAGKVGFEARRIPSHTVHGMSSLGFDYDGRFDSSWDLGGFFGFSIPFGG